MYRLRLVLLVSDPDSEIDFARLGIPKDFMPAGIEYLEMWVERPLVPNPGHHMWLGSNSGFAEKVSAVIHTMDEAGRPYYEVQLHIDLELAYIIGHQNTLMNEQRTLLGIASGDYWSGFLPFTDSNYHDCSEL